MNFQMILKRVYLSSELTSPLDGFGFDLIPNYIQTQSQVNLTKKRKLEKENLPELNEPFAPKINNLRIDYRAKTYSF